MLNYACAFSGLGAWKQGLDNLGLNIDTKFYCEFDPKTAKAYSIIHGVSEGKNLGDITKADFTQLPQLDLFCYSPPCTTFSRAGKQEGTNDPRGNLFFSSLEIIKQRKPKIAIMENVDAMLEAKFKDFVREASLALDEAGYNSYSKVLNGSDFGIPQNRKRILVVSIRKDIDNTGMMGFQFPEPIPLKLCIRDIKESEVPEKYYLSNALLNYFKTNCEKQKNNGNGFKFTPLSDKDVSKTITNYAKSRMDETYIEDLNGKIRKLMPIEVGRLFGMKDEIYHKLKAANYSDSHLYKMYGNSIVVNVTMAIFESLIEQGFLKEGLS